MTDSMKPFDEDLENLFKQRKQRTKAPMEIKHTVMLKAKSKQKYSTNAPFQGVLATAATLLIVIGLYQFTWFNDESTNTSKHNTLAVVEFHQLESESDISIADDMARVTQRYQDMGQLVANIQVTRGARIASIENGVVELVTCDDARVTISKELVAHLQSLDRVQTQLSVGNPVMLAQSGEGLILEILSLKKSEQQC